MTPEDNLRLYENDVNAEANIRKAISESFQNLKPEIELVQNYENQQFPAFYDAFHGYGAGTTAADLSPTTLLQNAWTNVGQKSTSANTARGVLDTRKAGMEDLIKTGINQWGLGYTGAQNQDARWWRQQQADEDRRRYEEQVELERQKLARMGSGSAATPAAPWPTGNDWMTEAYNAWLVDQAKIKQDYQTSQTRAANTIYNRPAEAATKISGYAKNVNPVIPTRTVVPTGSYQLDNIIKRMP